MEINSQQAYSILGVVGGEKGAIISKSGILTLVFEIQYPEVYSLYSEDYESIHNEYFKALKNMPKNSFVHKQDIFLKKKYIPELKETSFINKAENKHFAGRFYLEHRCILSFSLANIEDLESSYFTNPIAYKEKISEKSLEQVSIFIESVEGAVNIIKNVPNTSVTQMTEQEVKKYIFDYCNGFSGDKSMIDVHFAERLTIGQNKASVFSICDEMYLPDKVSTYVKDDTLPFSSSFLYMSELEPLGVHLLCNHIYNQFLWFEGSDKLKNELENRVKLFGQHRKFSTGIEIQHKKIEELKDEIFNGEKLLCRTSLNLIIWDEEESALKKEVEKVKEILRKADFQYYIPSFEGLKNIWIGSILGRENKLAKEYYFLTDLDVALCLWTNTTSFKSDEDGIYFNDRLFQVPIKKDIWDAKRRRIPARNAIVVANTGSGKSAATLNIVQQMIESKTKTIVCEFGKSFEQLTHLYPNVSMHIDYDGTDPLGINPFNLNGGKLSSEKKSTLVEIILKFWRNKKNKEDTNQVVSLTKFVDDYYENVLDEHSFPDFYNYVKNDYKKILLRKQIPDEYFDIHGFLHVCSEFIPGGKYENVCKKGIYEESILNKDFIVFELTKIKKDPFLTSLIMSILFDTIENKILQDKSTRGMLVFDEYAETLSMTDNYNGNDIHSTVAFCYQKLRKDNGAIMTIIQSPSQLPDNHYTKGIISNTQILYVLPTTEVVYDQVITTFKIQRKDNINLMKSIRNNFSGNRPYSEIYIRMLDSYNTVVRLEFSKEKFFSFQTDGEDWQAIHEDYLKTENMETSISNYITNKQN